jgi:hypothetical protein
MIMMRVRAYLTALAIIFCGSAHGYDVETHEVLTQAAARGSILQLSPGVLDDLGLTPTQEFPNTNGTPLTFSDLLAYGANVEDNLVLDLRVFRHFYNPINGQGLNVPLIPTFPSSPDWALARPGTLNDQEQSYWNARQSEFNALTNSLQGERNKWFGRTFQFLGQVVHHLQDMAQPQHVRNDPHCSSWLCWPVGLRAPSLYESWTNENLGGLPTDFGAAGYDITSPQFVSTFNSPRSFWNTTNTTNTTNATNPPGLGIAEFTNRNFVSAGTNFDMPGLSSLFPLPVLSESARFPRDIQDLCRNASPSCPNPNLHGRITFYRTPVSDFVSNGFTGTLETNQYATSLSIFDADLQKINSSGGNDLGPPRLFSLNRFNFSSAHAFLLPRAVAYSAGMMNYFFRGKIDYVPDPANPGGFLVMNLGTDPMKGQFQVYYDDATGTRRPVDGMLWDTQVILANDPDTPGVLAPGKGMPVPSIPLPTSPKAKTFGEFMLVFTGEMGQERPDPTSGSVGAVVGKLIQGAPYTGQLYVAGRDAQGRLVTFIVDPKGTRVLNGFDANGQSHSTPALWTGSSTQTDIDPLFPIVNPIAFSQILNKVIRIKQAAFQTSLLGGMSYRMNAAALALPSGGYLTYVLDAKKNRLDSRANTLSWLATDPNPAIGTFEFNVDLQNNVLGYKRTFRPTPGQALQTVTGSTPLPTDQLVSDSLRTTPAVVGPVVISPDGLTVSGFHGNSQTDAFTIFFDTYELRVTLGSAPSVALVQTEHLPLNPVNIVSPNNTNQSTGETTGTVGVDWTSTGHSVRINDGQRTDNDRKHFEDYIAGNAVTWRVVSQSVQTDETFSDSTDHETIGSAGNCIIQRTQDASGSTRNTQKFITTFTVTGLDQSLGWTSSDIPKGIPPNLRNYSESTTFHAVTLQDCFGNALPSPPPTSTDTVTFNGDALDVSPALVGTSLLRPLNGRVDGSIVIDMGGTTGWTLGGIRLGQTTDQFIADSSPLGEIFAASTDKGTIVFQPAPSSGMPATINIPANIVKLIAAIWL